MKEKFLIRKDGAKFYRETIRGGKPIIVVFDDVIGKAERFNSYAAALEKIMDLKNEFDEDFADSIFQIEKIFI